MGINHKRLERYGSEYKWISQYLRRELSFEEMSAGLCTDICRFAKRQMTFIKKIKKQGHRMIPITSFSQLLTNAQNWLRQ